MSPTPLRLRGALLALLALLATSCTSKDEAATSVTPQGPPAASSNVVRGTLLGVDGPPPKVEIKVFLDGTTLLSALTTTSLASGRWSVSGLSAGSYRFELTPPAPDPNDPSTNLRTTQIGNVNYGGGVLDLPPLLLAPVLDGGLLIRDNGPVDQFLKFRSDPLDTGSPVLPGLENMQFLVRSSTLLRFFGFSLAALGIDDNPNTASGELLVEIAILRPDQLPAPHIDEDGNSRTSQAYYALYPAGFDFLAPRELEIDYPNVNGLSDIYETPQLSFSHLTFDWIPAGVGDVSSDGLRVEQDNFDGVKQIGTIGAPGPPPPTTVVVGSIMSGGNPLAREGITVVTNSGFRALTDAAGTYRIEDVPIPLNRTDLVATATTDAGLAFATASAVARPIYPETTIDIDLVAIPLATPICDLASSEPAAGATGVETNARIRLRFDAEMDRDSLQNAISVVATPDGGATATITGTVVTQDVPMMGGAIHTDAFFLPNAPLPANASVLITLNSSATSVDGVALGSCTLSYRTGSSTLFLPRIDVVDPPRGPVGTSVELRGINLDIATLSFDGANLAATSKTPTRLTFTVPTSEGAEAPGPRAIQLAPGAIMDSFDILPLIEAVQIDTDPDVMVEVLADSGAGNPGTSIAGVDQNDGTLLVISGQNLFDTSSGLMPVVTFGRGDGDPTGATDGDAAIDGPDEAATEQRIDVNIAPRATTGDLTVTVDDGAGTTFTSPAFTYVIELPLDLTPPTVDMPALDPLPAAAGVLTSQVIRVELDEAVAGTSQILVGSGAPLRKVPGTTRVTTSLDGSVGILEFLPDAGALPASATIQVQLAGTTIVDLAGNPVANFDYTFATGATEPGGGAPPDRRAVNGGLVTQPLQPEGPAPVPTGSGSDSGGATALLRGLRLGEALLGGPAKLELPGDVAPVKGASTRIGDESLSLRDRSVADWVGLPPVARWRVEEAPSGPVAVALFVAERRVLDRDGRASIESFLRVELTGGEPDPARHAYRFRIADEEGRLQIVGLVGDLDQDGRFDLSLFSGSARDVAALGRSDLVQVGRDFLELGLPAHRPLHAGREPVLFLLESFDLQSASYASSPVLQFDLH